jgi:hypothetical protein
MIPQQSQRLSQAASWLPSKDMVSGLEPNSLHPTHILIPVETAGSFRALLLPQLLG